MICCAVAVDTEHNVVMTKVVVASRMESSGVGGARQSIEPCS
jgi:hypothetical protein